MASKVPVVTVGCLWELHGDLEWLVVIWIKLKVTLGFVLDIIPQTTFENSRFPLISSFTNPSYDQGDSTGQPIVSIFSVFIKSFKIQEIRLSLYLWARCSKHVILCITILAQLYFWSFLVFWLLILLSIFHILWFNLIWC